MDSRHKSVACCLPVVAWLMLCKNGKMGMLGYSNWKMSNVK